jgi:hypothetical protein
MKKENLIEQLNAAKVLSSQVDIDKVVELIKQIETGGFTAELASNISSKLESLLDNNSDDLVDLDSAEFELNYDNRIELSRVDVDISEIIQHVEAVLEEFTIEDEDLQVEAYNENFGSEQNED